MRAKMTSSVDNLVVENCEVLFRGSHIIIEYRDGIETKQYGGEAVPNTGNAEDGEHFELSNGHGGRATLHRFKGASRLVGEWFEGVQCGLWSIDL